MERLRSRKPRSNNQGRSTQGERCFPWERQTGKCRPYPWHSWELDRASENQQVHSYPSYHKTHPSTVTKPLGDFLSQGRCSGSNMATSGILIKPFFIGRCIVLEHRTIALKGVDLSTPVTMLQVMAIIRLEFNRSAINTRRLIGKAYGSWLAIMCQLTHFCSIIVCHGTRNWHHRNKTSGQKKKGKENEKSTMYCVISWICTQLKFWETLNQESYFSYILNFSPFKCLASLRSLLLMSHFPALISWHSTVVYMTSYHMDAGWHLYWALFRLSCLVLSCNPLQAWLEIKSQIPKS